MDTITADAPCRPDTLTGLWAIEPTRFERIMDVVRSVDVVKLAGAQAQVPAGPAGKAYTMREDGVACISLTGPLTKYPTSFQAIVGGTSMLRAREALRAVTRDPDVRGTMLLVDSPGGTVAGCHDLFEDIRRADAVKPVHAYIEDQACSAALFVAAAARRVWSNTSAEVGSIGAFARVEDTSGAYAMNGIKVHIISSAAPHKGAGASGTAISSEQLAEWERRMRDQVAVFLSALSQGRGMSPAAVDRLHTGQSWIASKAKEFGLIDGVVSFDDACISLRFDALTGARPTARKEADMQETAPVRPGKTAYAEATALAQELQQKGRANSHHAALAMVWDQNPDLYKRHVKERGETREKQANTRESLAAGRVPAGSAYAQMQDLARERVAQGKARTVELAFNDVAKERPDLYRAYLTEVGR